MVCLGLACGSPPQSPELGQHSASILGGQPSPASQDAVVYIQRGSYDQTCTGAVVAPNLILTVRHCFVDFLIEQATRLCEDEGGSRPILSQYEADEYAVFTGSQRPLHDTGALGVHVFGGPTLDICASDLALLQVDRPLGVDPLPLRLDEPPRAGEAGILVGWGATDADAAIPEGEITPPPAQRQQREIIVEAVGPTSYTPPGGTVRPIEAAAFVGGTGACSGDSGGPLISTTTGAIIGVQHAVRVRRVTAQVPLENSISTCVDAVSGFQRLDLQRDWLLQAFQSAGAAPWLEGHARPGSPGDACTGPEECSSGLCVNAGASDFCSQRCDDGVCPEGMECIGVDAGGGICSLPEVEAAAAEDAGCALSSGSPGLQRCGSWLIIAALVARRRRGR
jgi:hypothetical protein